MRAVCFLPVAHSCQYKAGRVYNSLFEARIGTVTLHIPTFITWISVYNYITRASKILSTVGSNHKITTLQKTIQDQMLMILYLVLKITNPGILDSINTLTVHNSLKILQQQMRS